MDSRTRATYWRYLLAGGLILSSGYLLAQTAASRPSAAPNDSDSIYVTEKPVASTGPATTRASSRPVCTQPADGAKWDTIYSTDFEGKIGREWSRPNVSETPVGSNKYLGPFSGGDSVRLLLPDIPDHKYVRVIVELYVMQTWGMVTRGNRPHVWRMDIEKGPELVRSTFSNLTVPIHYRQSFPDLYPGGRHAAMTGAAEKNKLGFVWYFSGDKPQDCDSVYRFCTLAPHLAGWIQINFAGSGLQNSDMQSWGLRKVIVEVCNEDLAPGYTEQKLDRLWGELGGEAMPAFCAVWELVAAGDKAADLIAAKVLHPVRQHEQRIRELVARLDDPKLEVREQASRDLIRLGVSAGPVLREFMEAVKSEETRARIADVLVSIGKYRGLGDPEFARWMRAVRVLEVQRSPRSLAVLKELTAKGPAASVRLAAVESLEYLKTGERKQPVDKNNANSRDPSQDITSENGDDVDTMGNNEINQRQFLILN